MLEGPASAVVAVGARVSGGEAKEHGADSRRAGTHGRDADAVVGGVGGVEGVVVADRDRDGSRGVGASARAGVGVGARAVGHEREEDGGVVCC